MKINDLTSSRIVDEGIVTTGVGKAIGKGIGAVGSAIGRGFGYDPEDAQANRLDARAKQIGLKMFTKQLTDLLTHAKKSGMLAPATVTQAKTGADATGTETDATASTGTQAAPTAPSAPNSLSSKQIDQQNAIKQMKATQSANAAKSSSDEQIRAAYKAAIAKPAFQQTLADKNAIKAGNSRGIKESAISKQYKLFGTLLEAEQITQTTEQFINQFLDTQTGKFKQYETYVSNLNVLAKKAANEFDSTGNITPETMNKMWENLWMWSKMSGGGSHSGTQSQTSSRQTSGEKANPAENKMSSEEIKKEMSKNSKRRVNGQDMKNSVKKLISALGGDISSMYNYESIPEDQISKKFEELYTLNTDDSIAKNKTLKALYGIAGTIL